jgi:hypothetical protein
MSTEARAGSSDQAATPGGRVTLIVGEVGRSRSSRSRPTANSAQERQSPAQWSFQWSGDAPGALVRAPEGEPDLTLTIGTDDARLIKQGELEPSVAFMRGRLKTSGDNALLLRVLAWSATPDFAKAIAAWSTEQPA